ncbi:MAG TPA: FkbM family methyltransferase [Flavobacteriales bacterium]|nr:FkbM family methyltransferase [Flavobacteriales bacterium]
MEITLKQYESIDPIYQLSIGNVSVSFCTPSEGMKWRVETLLSKEPATIEWISEFKRDEILLDIGANVGMYTIWAAQTRGAKVFAFEPESQNYALLNRNIVINQLGNQVCAYCTAISDTVGFDYLYLGRFSAGSSANTFGEKIDFKYRPLHPAYSQGCFSTTIDHLVTSGVLPIPQYMKIDVDGLEPKVIRGAKETIKDENFKSILVEINQNLEDHMETVKFLENCGFVFSQDQVDSSTRKDGPFKGIAEYVFRRQ